MNGQSFTVPEGSVLEMRGKRFFLDGIEKEWKDLVEGGVVSDAPVFNMTFTGCTIGAIDLSCVQDVKLTDCKVDHMKLHSSSISTTGDIRGNITAHSSSVSCKDVIGSIEAHSSSVSDFPSASVAPNKRGRTTTIRGGTTFGTVVGMQTSHGTISNLFY